ncbi:MAG: DNA polymerase II large subunit [Candidatus Altiarchaeota archaeon]|nr:DNA polymerase II large subunit [Candidatus Altiarchaeota archaeon]
MLDSMVEEQYKIAGNARSKNLDPNNSVEALPTRDLAERVEGLVGPKYIADEIKKAQEEGLGREKIVERIIDWILKGTYLKDTSRGERIEQALRTALAILTEGVVSAPLEGISKVTIEKNPDGSNYLAIYFAGPIRGAGGTAAALSVLLGDYIRRKEGIQNYRPTSTEIERYKEEIKIYHRRIVRLQYMPTDEEIETIVKNTPVCIDGDPTEDMEVDIYKGLERVATNRIRGGICLVIGEGLAQKYKKVVKFAEKINLEGWNWLKDIKKVETVQKKEEVREIRANKKFLEDIIAGRPIFAYPSTPGGFRLRYGRSNMCGIASKALSPATMEILEEFPVTGTQLRIERPGKGMIAVPCQEIEGPIVKDRSGNVMRINTVEEAKGIRPQLEEILFLGDILIPYGDFLNSNEILPPSGYVEEWWIQDYEKGTGAKPPGGINGKEAVELAREKKVPLHPKYTYPWHDINLAQTKKLVNWFRGSVIEFDFERNLLRVKNNDSESKRVLELLGIPHSVDEEGETITLEDHALPMLTSLGLSKKDSLDFERFDKVVEGQSDEENGLEIVKLLSPIKVNRKVGAYIGARMGRPEKAKERKMEPAPHSLFPVGEYGGRTRSIISAANNNLVQVEIVRRKCPNCKKITHLSKCSECGVSTYVEYKCDCGTYGKSPNCERCKKTRIAYEERELPVKSALEAAVKKTKIRPSKDLKGVKGMTSSIKMPEPLEKGILRAEHDVFVFKDGTVRYDGTDIPTTHFRPKDVGVSIERLKELGYGKDIRGEVLESAEQILALRVQDIIIPEEGSQYITNICKFIDDVLVKFYELEPFYKIEKKTDLVGHLIVGLAPHTSAAILGRIVGFANVRGILAHPFWHAAKRRNCDGDEDSIMMLLDVLLNFSHAYLPEKRGGRMDAPLVVNTNLNPREIDSEAHCMEMVTTYPISFYQKTQKLPSPKEMGIEIVEDKLDSNPFEIPFTHFSTWSGVPNISRYVQLGDMREKALSELKLCDKIRAVDANDVAKRLIDSHLIRDSYGNLRAFARQKFRCVKCNRKYRRVPLIGKCDKCGGKVILTVSKGTIEKYVQLTDEVVKEYVHSEYIKQRMVLLKKEIESVFENDKVKQYALSDFA